MSSTRTVARQTLMQRHPRLLGFAASADAAGVAAQTITDISQFQFSGYGPDEFRDYYIHRYNFTDNNRVKRATTLSGAVLTQGGSAYNDAFSDLAYELLPIDPDLVNNALVNSQHKIVARKLVPLTPLVDGDTQFATSVYWGEATALGGSVASNLTPTKVTDEVYNLSRSLKLLSTSGAGYTLGETLKCTPGQTVYMAAIVRADVGTVTMRLYNTTGAANFSESVSYAGEEWALVWVKSTIPTGCENYQPMFQLAATNDIAYVSGVFGPYVAGQRVFKLQDWLNENYKIKALRPSRFRLNIATGVESMLGREFYGDLVQPTDFSVEAFSRDVIPARLQLSEDVMLPQAPVWLSVERSLYDDGETLASEGATTSGDLDQIEAYTMIDLLENVFLVANPNDGYLTNLLANLKSRLVVEEAVRPPLPVKRQPFRGRGRL